MNTIEYFMWGYQSHFQGSAQISAESLFNELDEALRPKVFLVGALIEDREGWHPICIEPEDCGYKPELFSDLLEQAKHFEAIDPEKNILNTNPMVQKSYEYRIQARAFKNAVEQTIRQGDTFYNLISFCSYPTLVEGYKVCVVLQFDRKAFKAHYALIKKKIRERYRIFVSLLDATISEYFEECYKTLNKPDPGAGLGLSDRYADEIVRSAGKSFMRTPAYAGNDFMGLYGLFDACNTISSLKHEGDEGVGNLLIARKEHPNIGVDIALASPIKLNDYRATRKLLEMASGGVSLLSDAEHIYGLGKQIGSYDYSSEKLFKIAFTKHYTWELLHADHVMMRVAYGQPLLPKHRMNQKKFRGDLQRIFSDIEDAQIDNLWAVVEEAIKQRHGTMIMVSAGAKKEANRLSTQSTLIEPIQLTPEITRMITAIDGAVLIDHNSTCYAIGVILDGLATEKGSSSRGARYNSAVRYVEFSKYPCLAIVVSEDGTIDLIPDLMPQIHSSEINDAILTLKEMKEEKKYDNKGFYQTMNWLSEHRFYLLPATCTEINELRREIEKIRKEVLDPRIATIVYSDFTPNEDMNESYFFEEN